MLMTFAWVDCWVGICGWLASWVVSRGGGPVDCEGPSAAGSFPDFFLGGISWVFS
jgi:hypothetical protein